MAGFLVFTANASGAFWSPSFLLFSCDRPSSRRSSYVWISSLPSSSSLLPLCSLSMKELNYSASSPVELPTDAASEQARVVTVRRKLNAAMQMRPRREYRT